MRKLALYIASVMVLFMVFRWADHVERYERLEASGVRTTGTIVSTTCANHAYFKYEYVARGQLFDATGRSSAGGLPCASLSVGQAVPITYLEESPSVSIAGKPEDALLDARLSAIAAALVLPSIVLWMRHRLRRERPRFPVR